MAKGLTLYHRFKLTGNDVADAIIGIIAEDRAGLPMGIGRSMVVERLIIIANTDETGKYITMSESSKKFTRDVFLSSLTTSQVFRAGYERYEKGTGNPVVPVTDYFFNHVYEHSARDCLDAMTDIEIRQSLPRRTSLDRDQDNVVMAKKDENGDDYVSGKVAGVVVYPPNMPSLLLRAWASRRVSQSYGQVVSTANLMNHASPGSSAVAKVRKQMAELKPTMREALPKVKEALSPPEDEIENET